MCNGKQHDFNLFKESRVQILPTIKVFADSGYQGINKLHKNTEIPKKKTKKTSLSSQDKRNNRDISRTRIKIENIIAFIVEQLEKPHTLCFPNTYKKEGPYANTVSRFSSCLTINAAPHVNFRVASKKIRTKSNYLKSCI